MTSDRLSAPGVSDDWQRGSNHDVFRLVRSPVRVAQGLAAASTQRSAGTQLRRTDHAVAGRSADEAIAKAEAEARDCASTMNLGD